MTYWVTVPVSPCSPSVPFFFDGFLGLGGFCCGGGG